MNRVTSKYKKLMSRYGEYAAKNPRYKGIPAYLNWALAIFEMKLRVRNVRARPLKLTFEPTGVCQLRCPLCPTGLRNQARRGEHAELETFKRLMDEIGRYVFFIDFFNWGEPLLNPQLEDMVQIAGSNRIGTCISSNLSLPLPDERIKRLLTCGLDEIMVSLDGVSQQTYSTYRRGGNYELVLGNMRRIIEMRNTLGLKKPYVKWRFLVFKFNESEIEKARELAGSIGVDRLIFEAPYINDERFNLSQEDKKTVASWGSDDRAYNRNHPLYKGLGGKTPSAKSVRCDWHYVSSCINWDGTVSPCCTLYDDADSFGKLTGEKSYMAVYNNANYRAIRDRFAHRLDRNTDLACERCPTKDIQNYGKYVNRQIMFSAFVMIAEGLRRRIFRH